MGHFNFVENIKNLFSQLNTSNIIDFAKDMNISSPDTNNTISEKGFVAPISTFTRKFLNYFFKNFSAKTKSIASLVEQFLNDYLQSANSSSGIVKLDAEGKIFSLFLPDLSVKTINNIAPQNGNVDLQIKDNFMTLPWLLKSFYGINVNFWSELNTGRISTLPVYFRGRGFFGTFYHDGYWLFPNGAVTKDFKTFDYRLSPLVLGSSGFSYYNKATKQLECINCMFVPRSDRLGVTWRITGCQKVLFEGVEPPERFYYTLLNISIPGENLTGDAFKFFYIGDWIGDSDIQKPSFLVFVNDTLIELVSKVANGDYTPAFNYTLTNLQDVSITKSTGYSEDCAKILYSSGGSPNKGIYISCNQYVLLFLIDAGNNVFPILDLVEKWGNVTNVFDEVEDYFVICAENQKVKKSNSLYNTGADSEEIGTIVLGENFIPCWAENAVFGKGEDGGLYLIDLEGNETSLNANANEEDRNGWFIDGVYLTNTGYVTSANGLRRFNYFSQTLFTPHVYLNRKPEKHLGTYITIGTYEGIEKRLLISYNLKDWIPASIISANNTTYKVCNLLMVYFLLTLH